MVSMTHEAFLKDIVENPDDDSVRLIYADWLEENGQAERAEFIRVQVELARHPMNQALQQRNRQLRETNRDRWRAELPKLRGILWQRFWRGFVSGADVLTWKHFRLHADAMFAATPIQFLRLIGLNPAHCQELVFSPYLSRLQGLDLSLSRPGDTGVRTLATSFLVRNLRSLVLNPVPTRSFGPRHLALVSDPGALALAASPYLGALELLVVRGNHLSGAAAQALRERFGERVLL